MKHYKPTTKSRRNMSSINYRQFVTTNEPEKSLTKGFSRGNGRNNTGRVTTRHKGGGHKRLFRAIDFLFDKRDVPFVVKTVEYDPNRSGGDYAEILAKDGGYVDIKLPSTEVRKVPVNAWATIGEVSNNENRLVKIGKAGRNRWLGIRPTVRGTAMNPVDHPHGGGEGRQGRGRRRAISIYGKPTGKGQKSRRSKKYSNKFIVNRRRVGKK